MESLKDIHISHESIVGMSLGTLVAIITSQVSFSNDTMTDLGIKYAFSLVAGVAGIVAYLLINLKKDNY